MVTTALHAVPASTNVPQAQSQRAKSTLSTPTYVLTAALAQTFAPLVQSLRANNSSAHVNLTQKGCFASFLPQSGGRTQSSSFLFVSSSNEEHPMQRHVPAAWGVRGFWGREIRSSPRASSAPSKPPDQSRLRVLCVRSLWWSSFPPQSSRWCRPRSR